MSASVSHDDSSSLFMSDDDDDEMFETASTVGSAVQQHQMTGRVAVECLQRLVNLELHAAGYETADSLALEHLHGLAVVFFEALVQRAHELTEQAARTNVNLKDAIAASVELGVANRPADFVALAHATQDRNSSAGVPTLKFKRVKRPVIEKTLPSDDDDDEEEQEEHDVNQLEGRDKSDVLHQSIIPKVKPRKLPEALKASYLPQLPPKHTFKQTPVYPQPAAPPTIPNPTYEPRQKPSTEALRHLATLRARFNDSQMVASSLRNLIRKTSVRTVVAQQQQNLPATAAPAPAAAATIAEIAVVAPETREERAVQDNVPEPLASVEEPAPATVDEPKDDAAVNVAAETSTDTVEQVNAAASEEQALTLNAMDVDSTNVAAEPSAPPSAPAAQPVEDVAPQTATADVAVVDAATAAASLEEEWTDIVDYEGEWYGSATSRWTSSNKLNKNDDGVSGAGEGRSASTGGLIVLKVGKDGLVDKEDLEANGLTGSVGPTSEGVGSKFGATGWIDAGRVGVASKRRKWRA
ncbi:hypothetical protein ACM66B_001787 [Microbotryomycetes sp. NB124-2]